MKYIVQLIILIISFTSLRGQEDSRAFGTVSQEQLDLVSYPKDRSTDAVVLFDQGKTIFYDFEGGYNIRMERHRRIKVMKKSGVKHAEITIPFYVDGYGKTEKIRKIEGFTHNMEDGRIVKKALEVGTVYEEKINNNWLAKKFVFPDVKVGSIIEYKYILESPFHFNLPDWEFQSNIPTIYSKYIVQMIPFYEYLFIAQGISKFDFYAKSDGTIPRSFGSINKVVGLNAGDGVEFKDLIHTYVMKDIPALKDESYITSVDDYRMKIDFQLARVHGIETSSRDIVTTWEKLNEHLFKHDNFGKFINKAEKIASKMFSTEISKSGDEESKVQNIIQFVRKNFKWDGRNTKYANVSPKELIEKKIGSAAEINLFLIGMLRAAGINTEPIISSTRNHGKIRKDYPFSHFFNYVLVKVNLEKSFITDGTASYLAFDRIPPRCINEEGLIVNPKKVNWISLENEQLSSEVIDIDMKININSLTCQNKITIQTDEYASYYYKKAFVDNKGNLESHFNEKSLENIENLLTTNFNNYKEKYSISFTGESSLEKIEDLVIIKPYLNFPIQKNKLTQRRRNYPIDLIYAQGLTYKSQFKIPDGYILEKLPENYDKSNDILGLKIDYLEKDGTVTINSKYQLKKAVYQPGEYAAIKAFYNILIKRLNEEIVLKEI